MIINITILEDNESDFITLSDANSARTVRLF